VPWRARSSLSVGALLAFVRFHRFVDLPFHYLHVEGCQGLHRRKLDVSLGESFDLLVDEDKPP